MEGSWHRLAGVAVAPQRRVYRWLRLCEVFERERTGRDACFFRRRDSGARIALRSVYDLVSLAQSTPWEPLLDKLPEEVQRLVFQAYVRETVVEAFRKVESTIQLWRDKADETRIPPGYQRLYDEVCKHSATAPDDSKTALLYRSMKTPRQLELEFYEHVTLEQRRRKEFVFCAIKHAFHSSPGFWRTCLSPWIDRALLACRVDSEDA